MFSRLRTHNELQVTTKDLFYGVITYRDKSQRIILTCQGGLFTTKDGCKERMSKCLCTEGTILEVVTARLEQSGRERILG